jgi:hypothetical protein
LAETYHWLKAPKNSRKRWSSWSEVIVYIFTYVGVHERHNYDITVIIHGNKRIFKIPMGWWAKDVHCVACMYRYLKPNFMVPCRFLYIENFRPGNIRQFQLQQMFY